MQQRYYDPIAGRFLSVDPIVTDANTGKGFGLYTYVENNPYNRIDPDGREQQLLIGGPYSDHGYGHVALRVFGKGYDITYDFGRYGKTSGAFGAQGEGMLRVWSNNAKYMAGENATGRTTTAYTFKTSADADKATIAHFEKAIGGASPALERDGMKQFKISDYDAANNNCTTIAMGGLGAGAPDIASKLNNSAFDLGTGLGTLERLAYRAAKKGDGIRMPLDLQKSIDSSGSAASKKSYPDR